LEVDSHGIDFYQIEVLLLPILYHGGRSSSEIWSADRRVHGSKIDCIQCRVPQRNSKIKKDRFRYTTDLIMWYQITGLIMPMILIMWYQITGLITPIILEFCPNISQ
jgi:hypothetical protein